MNSAGGEVSLSNSFEGRENEKVGVGRTFVVRIVLPGLGNVGMVKPEPVLSRLGSYPLGEGFIEELLCSCDDGS